MMKKTLIIFLFLGVNFSWLDAQSSRFQWGFYTQGSRANITDIYEWRNFYCFEGCESIDHKASFSFDVGLLGSLAIRKNWLLNLRLGYQDFNYVEVETWSPGAGIFTQDTERNMQHYSLGLGIQHTPFSIGTTRQQLYFSATVLALWNNKQWVNFGNNDFEGTIKVWNTLGEFGVGVQWPMGKGILSVGPHFRFALADFAKAPNSSVRTNENSQLFPRELGISIQFRFQ